MRLLLLTIFIFFQTNLSYAIEFKGKFEQGSFILGKTDPDTKIQIDKKKIRVSKDGFFAFGLGRDRKNDVVIKIYEKGKSKIVNPGAIVTDLSEVPTWKIILTGQHRIMNFHHIDYYFWVSVSVLAGKPALGVWLLFTILGINMLLRFKLRLKAISKFE